MHFLRRELLQTAWRNRQHSEWQCCSRWRGIRPALTNRPCEAPVTFCKGDNTSSSERSESESRPAYLYLHPSTALVPAQETSTERFLGLTVAGIRWPVAGCVARWRGNRGFRKELAQLKNAMYCQKKNSNWLFFFYHHPPKYLPRTAFFPTPSIRYQF